GSVSARPLAVLRSAGIRYHDAYAFRAIGDPPRRPPAAKQQLQAGAAAPKQVGEPAAVLRRSLHGRSCPAGCRAAVATSGTDVMTESKSRVVSVGEVMVELARGNDGRYGLAFGGDTFNTAVYLARAGVEVAYATALGDDPYSAAIMEMAGAEGIASDLMLRVADRMPGLYLIETDRSGER